MMSMGFWDFGAILRRDAARRSAFSPPEILYFRSRAGGEGRANGARPRGSGAEGCDGVGQAGEERGFGMAGGEGEAHGAGGFHHARSDLDEAQTQRAKLRLRQIAGFRNGVTHGEHQPIGAGVQHKPDLVGDG